MLKRVLNHYLGTFTLLGLVLFPPMVHSAVIEVFVSILPQQYLVEQIGGKHVNVNVMVKPGQSPETFEPSPKIMSLYSKSDVYYTIGLPFEQVWIDRVASLNEGISIVNTQASLNELIENQSEHHAHGHGQHEAMDPHTWLSPVLYLQQARLVLQSLIQILPEEKELFVFNYNALSVKIKALHDDMVHQFKDNDKHRFITFHPAFSYFARQYNLAQISIEVEGKEPSAKQIAKVIKSIQKENVAYILIEKQFNQVIPGTIAKSVNAELLVLDPLALDYLVNMRDIAHKINKALF